ncbi:GxxExxY protein [Paramagnetospirillum kuznetsovii]|uniref:GxxExxY protein n=1 Tax=Paramagnetospirillum kuznetsovii TaxID=2053833 RepID=A0A364NV92_9PROT|nr:GxxExxY protein [Paramagnetospirillum kuznetsovii]RAU21004.1 GxxExxY protein [Paramagnetospirillum kuznetsovii]
MEGSKEFDALSRRVIGLAIEVHKVLGPGLLESAYEQCLAHELELNEIPFRRQVPVPVVYKGMKLDCAYRLDLVVADTLVLEIKAVEKLLPVHSAQLLTYLKLTRISAGLLLNFNSEVLRDGMKRVVL